MLPIWRQPALSGDEVPKRGGGEKLGEIRNRGGGDIDDGAVVPERDATSAVVCADEVGVMAIRACADTSVHPVPR